MRQSLGLFLRPLAATGLGIATVSLALAAAQFFWGLAQPTFGVLAERVGARRVIVGGGLLLAAGLALTPLVTGPLGLFATLGVVSAMGAGAASFAILIGAVARRVPAEHHALASGFINSGASLGQFAIAPLAQVLIAWQGWQVALWALAALAAATTVLAGPATGEARGAAAAAATPPPPLLDMFRTAFADRSYWCLHASFFSCGFHIAFLVTHLPNEVALCGLPAGAAATGLAIIGVLNVAGSLTFGWLGSRYRFKSLLGALYCARLLAVAAYLLAPKTILTVYVFSAVLGFTWLATVPATAGLIGKLFGARHVSTLLGMTLVTHQTGAFFGAWLGGVIMARSGSYHDAWIIDMVLAAAAAVINVPIRERPVVRAVAVATGRP
ncbi:MAG: MFS transporter [Proteobacteria bacterium]|nr:MFS transporter [Pseudomonadota bacterium]